MYGVLHGHTYIHTHSLTLYCKQQVYFREFYNLLSGTIPKKENICALLHSFCVCTHLYLIKQIHFIFFVLEGSF